MAFSQNGGQQNENNIVPFKASTFMLICTDLNVIFVACFYYEFLITITIAVVVVVMMEVIIEKNGAKGD